MKHVSRQYQLGAIRLTMRYLALLFGQDILDAPILQKVPIVKGFSRVFQAHRAGF